MQEFIVAEISKNWDGTMLDGQGLPPRGYLAQAFEDVIAVNWQRGYVLDQFQLHRCMTGERVLNETIIAVFRLRRSAVEA